MQWPIPYSKVEFAFPFPKHSRLLLALFYGWVFGSCACKCANISGGENHGKGKLGECCNKNDDCEHGFCDYGSCHQVCDTNFDCVFGGRCKNYECTKGEIGDVCSHPETYPNPYCESNKCSNVEFVGFRCTSGHCAQGCKFYLYLTGEIKCKCP